MKNLLCILIPTLILLVCGCSPDTHENVIACAEITFKSEEAFLEFLKTPNEISEELISRNQRNDKELDAIDAYLPRSVPDGFKLDIIRHFGSYITYSYTNDETKEQFSFRWAYVANGSELLPNSVKAFQLEPVENMEGYYYKPIIYPHENPVPGYQIYWEEEGYCFGVNVPERIFPMDTATHKSLSNFYPEFLKVQPQNVRLNP